VAEEWVKDKPDTVKRDCGVKRGLTGCLGGSLKEKEDER